MNNNDFTTIKECIVPHGGFPNFQENINSISGTTSTNTRLEKLELSSGNMTLPYALMLLDSNSYSSLSKSRKAIRNGSILIHRNSKTIGGTNNDRVYPSDKIAIQVRSSGSFYPDSDSKMAPNYTLPILYQDDYIAIVNKPAGIVVYAHRHDDKVNSMPVHSIRSKLPFVLDAPKNGTMAILRRPQPVHRLDKTTSGILLVAKTKDAMIHLARQFRDRVVQKHTRLL